jgi:hypothetical protein
MDADVILLDRDLRLVATLVQGKKLSTADDGPSDGRSDT